MAGNLQRNNQIGYIGTWGPLFRISFDLVIHSKPTPDVAEYYSILAFKGNGGTSDCCNVGDRVPVIMYTPPQRNYNERLHLTTAIGSNGNDWKNYEVTLEINQNYSFVIEQKPVNGKVDNIFSMFNN